MFEYHHGMRHQYSTMLMKSFLVSGFHFVALVIIMATAHGDIVFTTAQSGPNTPSTALDEVAFAADVSSTDLLHGLTGSGGSWNSGPSDVSGLNDGVNGGDFDNVGINALNGAAWSVDGTGSFREFTLGTGANGFGFDITEIQSIAAWQGAGFQNQKYEIHISTVGNPAFTLLTTVDYQPAPWVSADAANARGGATKVNVSDSSGLLAAGVDAIRFNILDTVSNDGGGVVMREIDVFGSATAAGIGNPAPLRIMCLGDSITAGYTDNPDWTLNHLFKFGYRSGLYTRLTNADYNFLFVGASGEPWNNAFGDPSRSGSYTPTLDLRALGQDGHRGYGGRTASYLQGNIVSWLNSDNSDIILLKIGTNDQSTGDLNTLVNTIVTTKPNAHLIIAEIMPTIPYSSAIVNYNNYIRNTLVPNYQAQGKKVTLVDQYAPFLTNPTNLTSIDQTLFSNGINHPDNDGYEKMAQVWFNGIKSLGLAPNTFKNWISDYPEVGNQTGLDQDPDGDGTDNGVENFFGTAPDQFSPGLLSGVKTGNSFIFSHPQAATPASDITGFYRWSKDLTSFHAEGAADGDSTTVSFVIQPNTPSSGTTTVTGNITGTPTDKLFLKACVSSN